MGGGFPIKAFGNDKLVLTEVGNGQCITCLPNVYLATHGVQTEMWVKISIKEGNAPLPLVGEGLGEGYFCINTLMTEIKQPIVEIRNLSKSYRRGIQVIPVLENINFDIPEGEFLALMGPSGSGKSTLLNLIAGIDKTDTGTVMVGGLDITSMTETELARWRATNVGFIFQFYNLIPVLTAFENVELPLLLTWLSRKERREHVEMALQMVGLSDRMDHYPSQLSGGQQQRVAIARAIVTDPTLLVADEPTGDLDRISAEEILELMARLNQEFGKTIIMVTHDPHAAERAHIIRKLEKGILNAHSQTHL
jgi:putative ABC transport system ATP-binding protein